MTFIRLRQQNLAICSQLFAWWSSWDRWTIEQSWDKHTHQYMKQNKHKKEITENQIKAGKCVRKNSRFNLSFGFIGFASYLFSIAGLVSEPQSKVEKDGAGERRPWSWQRADEWGHSSISQHQLSVSCGPQQKTEGTTRDAAEVRELLWLLWINPLTDWLNLKPRHSPRSSWRWESLSLSLLLIWLWPFKREKISFLWHN